MWYNIGANCKKVWYNLGKIGEPFDLTYWIKQSSLFPKALAFGLQLICKAKLIKGSTLPTNMGECFYFGYCYFTPLW